MKWCDYMRNDIDTVFVVVSDSSNLICDDKLAKVIESNDQELTDEELDFVAAAAKMDYQKFLYQLRRTIHE